MSHVLEALGRGLPRRLLDVFGAYLPGAPGELADLQQRLVQAPASLELCMRLSSVYLHASLLAEAREMFADLQRREPAAIGPLVGLACICDELGWYDQARAYLERATHLDGDDPVLQFAIGVCLERAGRPDQARKRYQAARAVPALHRKSGASRRRTGAITTPSLLRLDERLAALAIAGGDWSDAQRCYRSLARLSPGDTDIHLTLAALHLQNGQPRQALEGYQQALLIQPELEDDSHEQFNGLEEESEIRAAIRALEDMVQTYPAVTELRVHLGDMYAKMGDDRSAVSQYHAALALHPTFLEATVKLGTQHLRRGRYIKAARAFARATELNDRLLAAFTGLGLAQQGSNAHNDALATFDLVAGLAPNSALLFSETLRLLQRAATQPAGVGGETQCESEEPDGGRIGLVCRRFERALTERPVDAALHYLYGLLLRQLGCWRAALRSFHQAAMHVPWYGPAQVQLGVCMRESGQAAEAMETFRRAVVVDPAVIDTHHELVQLFGQRSQSELVLEHFERTADAGLLETLRPNLQIWLGSVRMIHPFRVVWNTALEMVDLQQNWSDEDRFSAQRPFFAG